MPGVMTIGKVAEAAGCKVQTIRYYEQIGLLDPPERSEGNQRLFDRKTVRELLFIRHARELGFPLEDIRELMGLAKDPERSCEAVDAIARRQLERVLSRMERLATLRGELERMVSECSGGRVAECRVIEVLSES